ncbi:C40 family peptidase [Nocardia sp. NPDC003482]
MGAAVVALGALGALVLTSGQAQAQTLDIPGIGVLDLPGEIPTPGPLPGTLVAIPEDVAPAVLPDTGEIAAATPVPEVTVESAAADVWAAVQSFAPGLDLRSLPGFSVPAPQAAPPAEPQKSTGQLAVEAAESKLGSNYSYGSAGPDSFDCSGLVQWSYEQAGVDLPRTSYEQLDSGTPVGLDELQPGDLVSFYGGQHSALYAGDGMVVHAATSGTGVVMSPMAEMPVTGARRF